MWLFTNFGFFSVVEKSGSGHLTVRARVRADLDRLRERYLPELGLTQAKGGTDYRWRAMVAHADLAAAMGRIVADLHYPNFKSEVAARQGKARAHRYGEVWEALYDMPEDPPEPHAKRTTSNRGVPPPGPLSIPTGMKAAYGGVVFDQEGRVLLREPLNHFDGYVWTFAKGRQNPGEKPEATALREVLEETGIQARLLALIPGEFAGGTTVNRYFLMEPDEEAPSGQHDRETASIRWATPEEARKLIGQTQNTKGRARDLEVLEAALGALAQPTFGRLFYPVPHPWWGLRGDPFLWEELRDWLAFRPLPDTFGAFAAQLEEAFLALAGVPISHQGNVFIERLAHGGMSSGHIALSFWQRSAFPLLFQRFGQLFPEED